MFAASWTHKKSQAYILSRRGAQKLLRIALPAWEPLTTTMVRALGHGDHVYAAEWQGAAGYKAASVNPSSGHGKHKIGKELKMSSKPLAKVEIQKAANGQHHSTPHAKPKWTKKP